MSTFNGPAHAAEALLRLQQADEAEDVEARRHLRESAQVYATLAQVAASLGPRYGNRYGTENNAWNEALGGDA